MFVLILWTNKFHTQNNVYDSVCIRICVLNLNRFFWFVIKIRIGSIVCFWLWYTRVGRNIVLAADWVDGVTKNRLKYHYVSGFFFYRHMRWDKLLTIKHRKPLTDEVEQLTVWSLWFVLHLLCINRRVKTLGKYDNKSNEQKIK